MEKYTCGSEVEKGTYKCCNCGQIVNLDKKSTLPPCPNCTNQTYTKE